MNTGLRSQKLAILLLPILLFHIAALCEDRPGTPGEWSKPGATWKLKVKVYPRPLLESGMPRLPNEKPPNPKVEFDMIMRVLESNSTNRSEVVQFRFEADKEKVKDDIRSIDYQLQASKTTGDVVSSTILPDPKYKRPEFINEWDESLKSGDWPFLLSNSIGYPVDWITSPLWFHEPVKHLGTRSLRIKYYDKEYELVQKVEMVELGSDRVKAVRVEIAAPKAPYDGGYRVVQTWVPGEAWWRTFERYLKGRLDLKAERVLSEP